MPPPPPRLAPPTMTAAETPTTPPAPAFPLQNYSNSTKCNTKTLKHRRGGGGVSEISTQQHTQCVCYCVHDI